MAKEVLLKEQGPRFSLKPFRIVQGAVDNAAPDVEWALNGFTNTAFKRQIL